MDANGELFFNQSTIGAKLERIIDEQGYTKTVFCKKAALSRPTLDKVLAGLITSKTNYEKHINKIMKTLGISADVLLENKSTHNKCHSLRNILKISSSNISQAVNISIKRLNEIEAGAEMTIIEKRDLALCLATSTFALQGYNFLDAPISIMHDFIHFSTENTFDEYSGFCGHVGILLNNSKEYTWYPITENIRKFIYKRLDNKYIVIPCMNNKVLFINSKYLKELRFLDEACDAPSDANWDKNVSEGEIPQVIYEALEDYIYEKDIDYEKTMSDNFRKYLDDLCLNMNWTEEDLYSMIHGVRIWYGDGNIRLSTIDFSINENVSIEISSIIDFGDDADAEKIFYFENVEENEIHINIENVAMLELPYAKLEEKLYENYCEIMDFD